MSDDQPIGFGPADPVSPSAAPNSAAAPQAVAGKAARSAAWLWVPTLYFAEGIPNSVVTDTAQFFYTDLGVGAKDLGVITGSMYLAWVVKPLWSPFVELIKTKRWWIVGMQVMLALCFFALAASIQLPSWLFWTAACLWVLAFVSATHDIAADGFFMLGLDERQQAALTGVRSTFYRLAMLTAKGFMVAMAGRLTLTMGKEHSWSAVFATAGALYLACALYHLFVLPKPATDVSASSDNFLVGYVESFASFFRKPGLGTAIPFMLLFRFAEVQLLSLVAPFLKGARSAGGLAMSTEQVGIAYGTVGVIGIMIGGILGGWLVSRYGLRQLYWAMIFIMHLPNLAFLYLATYQPDSLPFISACLFVEQFAYGFGFTIYTLYLIYFSKGDRQTAHFAIATGFMAASVMIPKMFSGYVQEQLGFRDFYIYIILCTIPSFIVSWLAWRDQKFLDTFKAPEEE